MRMKTSDGGRLLLVLVCLGLLGLSACKMTSTRS